MWLSNLAVRIFRLAGRGLLACFCSQNRLYSLHKYWINAKAISGAWVTQPHEWNIAVPLGLPPIKFGLILYSWTHASSSTTVFIATTWKGASESHVIPAACDLAAPNSHADLLNRLAYFSLTARFIKKKVQGEGPIYQAWLGNELTLQSHHPIKAEDKLGCLR